MPAPGLTGAVVIDSWTGAAGHTTAPIAWGGTSTDLVLVVAVSVLSNNNTVATVTGVSDSLGLTWHKAAVTSQIGITNGITAGPVAQRIEIWYATAAGTPTWANQTISITTDSNTDDCVLLAHRLSGCLLAVPLDANSSLPAHIERNSASVAAALTLTGVSTTTSNAVIFAMRAAAGAGNNINSGTFQFNSVSSDYGNGTLVNNVNFNIMSIAGKGYTAPQTNVSIASATTTANSMILAIAFTADAQVAPLQPTARAMIVG